MVIENLPFDKYELEPSPLTLFILGRKQPNYCWQVFIQGSTRNGDPGHPFGYLKVDYSQSKSKSKVDYSQSKSFCSKYCNPNLFRLPQIC